MELTVSAPAPLRLRPLEVGDVLDETFRIYRRHFLLFAGISMILAIPSAGLQGYGFFSLFNNLFLSPFIYGSVINAVCESAQGRPVTFWGALEGVWRR